MRTFLVATEIKLTLIEQLNISKTAIFNDNCLYDCWDDKNIKTHTIYPDR